MQAANAPRYDVLGIGNAIVDVLADADDALLGRLGLNKGAMTLVDPARAREIEAAMPASVTCSGGSAANTMAGLASFGARAAYIGRVRDDALGRAFRDGLEGEGVAFAGRPAAAGPPTGRCLVLVTPDGERTMQTLLGAAAELAPEDVDERAVADARVVYLEGYLWDPPPAKAAMQAAAQAAHAAGRKVALSLSDRFCVDRHRADFVRLLGDVDLLFANEDEVVALFQARDFDEAAARAGEVCEVAALTRGARGSVVVTRGDAIAVPAEPVGRVVDTTGAGDLYAAGFLFGWTRGQDPAACARLGGIAAAEVIGHYGARPRVSLADRAESALGSGAGQ